MMILPVSQFPNEPHNDMKITSTSLSNQNVYSIGSYLDEKKVIRNFLDFEAGYIECFIGEDVYFTNTIRVGFLLDFADSI